MKRLCVLRKWGGVFTSIVLAASALFCVAGCGENTDRKITATYRVEVRDSSGSVYYDKYVLWYFDDTNTRGSYTRYINGTINGKYFNTNSRIEDGSFEANTGITSYAYNTIFKCKSKLDLSTNHWEILDTPSTYYGHVTDSALTVNSRTYDLW
ncbi:MAG: hypothetical protein K2O09_02240 [Treponemataceae bacterium]|nr:hypothetical protein [Treponemataceae bacterium]